MVNATEMAKPFGKSATHWLRNQSTQEFLTALAALRNCKAPELVIIENGVGCWMHEDVALEFARWLSPVFAIWCNDKIKELLLTGATAINRAARKPRKCIAPRLRDERCGQFYEDLTRLVTHEDEREIATRFEVSRSFVHDVLRGQKTGYRVLEALVARAKENRRNGVERVMPFMASAEMHAQLVLDFYCGEE